MIVVFKTDVASKRDAKLILSHYRIFLPDWKINFDLDDCDKILRIDSGKEVVQVEQIKNTLTKFGCTAELLTN